MRGNTKWYHRPYQPMNSLSVAKNPYICRLAPFSDGVEVQILDNGAPGAVHQLKIRPMGTSEEWQIHPLDGDRTVITGLAPWSDYEIIAERADGTVSSALRFFRTGEYPGRMVNYLHPKDMQYAFSGRALCTPCIARLPSGTLMASMDVFASRAPQNLELIFRSRDDGRTWEYVTDLFPCTWGLMFVHRGRLYMMATSTEHGDLLISASDDEGETWLDPTRIFHGSGSALSCGWQRQAMPIIEHHGKLLTSLDYGGWVPMGGYGIHTLSIDADADLLIAENWNVSEGTAFNPDWSGAPKGGKPGLLEGNLFAAPDGSVKHLLRMQINSCSPSHGLACILNVDMNGLDAAPQFDRIIEMPTGSNSKTYVQFDPVSRKYWAIGNLVTNPATPSMRTVVGLCVSDDGYAWRTAKTLFDYSRLNPAEVGMQYQHFIIDGDDILWLSRTAFNQAGNFHDANCQTFHRIENFRLLD